MTHEKTTFKECTRATNKSSNWRACAYLGLDFECTAPDKQYECCKSLKDDKMTQQFKIGKSYDGKHNEITLYNVYEEGECLADLNIILTTGGKHWAKKVCDKLNELNNEKRELAKEVIFLKNALNRNIRFGDD